jgi:hypothetical protein
MPGSSLPVARAFEMMFVERGGRVQRLIHHGE